MAILTAPLAHTFLINVRTVLGQPDASNSSWSDNEILLYINEGLRRYFGEVIQNNEGHFVKKTSLDIVQGVETIALPADFFKARAIYYVDGSLRVLLPYDAQVTHGYAASNSNADGFYTYHFRGTNLVLRDTPVESKTGGIEVEYIAFPEQFTGLGDTLQGDVSPVFQDVITAYAVWKAKNSESIRSNGAGLANPAAEYLSSVYGQFKDAIKDTSFYPEYTKPFDPEGY